MSEIETVGLRAFSNSVSAYVKKASLGVRVLLSDRGRVVAELRKPGSLPDESELNSLISDWIKKGWYRLGSKHPVELPDGPSLVSPGTSQAVLDELRNE